MSEIFTVGLDLAKNVFQAHRADASGRTVSRDKLKRDQVPTWNYVAVHLRGRLEPLPTEALRPMVDDLTAIFEERLLPKKPWVSTKMSDGVMERMLRMILPFRLVIEDVEGTWKLGQNKTAEQRAGAVAGLEPWSEPNPRAELARLMRQVTAH